MKKSKQEKMLDLIDQLQELFPEMSKIITDDLQNPGFLAIADEDNFAAFAYILSQTDGEYRHTTLEEELEEQEEDQYLKLLGWDDEDDDGGGFIQ